MQKNYSFRNRWQNLSAICLIAIVLVMCILPAAASQALPPGKTKIIVGGESNNPPFSFLNEKGEPVGFSVELTRAIAKTMGMDVEVRLSLWADARKALENGKIDVILGMFYSEERAKIYDFSPPFVLISNAIFARKDSPPANSISDLRNKEIIVMRGEVMHDYIIKNRLTDRLLVTEAPDEALRLLASGKGDYALVAQMLGFYWIKELKLSNVKTVGPFPDPFKNCFAVRKGNKILLSRFTEGLNIIHQTGEHQRLYEKWLGILEPTKITPLMVFKYAAIVVVPLILLLTFSFIWSWMLRSKVKQKTKALKESVERFHSLVSNIPGIVYRCANDSNWTMLYISHEIATVTDYPASDFINNAVRSYASIIHPDDLDLVYLAVQKGVKERAAYTIEYRICRADAHIRWVHEQGQGVFAPDGNLLWLDGVILDITERKEVEDEKFKLEDQLLQSHKMEAIGTLAGGIAHDFNNILSVIIGYTELARDRNQKENKEHYLQDVLKGAERARNLVKQILTFSRQDNHDKKPLDIKILLKEAVKFLRSTIPATIEINQHITDEDCSIMADPTQMHQVIMNLCTNSSHAMKEAGGTLKIELANLELAKEEIPHHAELQPGHYVKLTVSDTGHGIDPAIVQRVFEPFFTTKSIDEGTGLGLSVVYGIVKGHGGVINLYSEQGNGTAFHVYLPRIMQTEKIEADSGNPVIGGTERILFVDDEPSLVDIGMRMLTSLGYRTTVAESSIEALEIFTAGPQSFDLVITDMTLPKMTGIDLSRKLLQIRPDIPIILC